MVFRLVHRLLKYCTCLVGVFAEFHAKVAGVRKACDGHVEVVSSDESERESEGEGEVRVVRTETPSSPQPSAHFVKCSGKRSRLVRAALSKLALYASTTSGISAPRLGRTCIIGYQRVGSVRVPARLRVSRPRLLPGLNFARCFKSINRNYNNNNNNNNRPHVRQA